MKDNPLFARPGAEAALQKALDFGARSLGLAVAGNVLRACIEAAAKEGDGYATLGRGPGLLAGAAKPGAAPGAMPGAKPRSPSGQDPASAAAKHAAGKPGPTPAPSRASDGSSAGGASEGANRPAPQVGRSTSTPACPLNPFSPAREKAQKVREGVEGRLKCKLL